MDYRIRCVAAMSTALISLGALTGCGHSHVEILKQQKALREEIAVLRDDLAGLNDRLEKTLSDKGIHPRRGVTVLGRGDGNLQIEISPQSILLRGQPVTIRSLKTYVRRLVAKNPNVSATILADDRVPQARIRQVMGALQRAGLHNVRASQN